MKSYLFILLALVLAPTAAAWSISVSHASPGFAPDFGNGYSSFSMRSGNTHTSLFQGYTGRGVSISSRSGPDFNLIQDRGYQTTYVPDGYGGVNRNLQPTQWSTRTVGYANGNSGFYAGRNSNGRLAGSAWTQSGARTSPTTRTQWLAGGMTQRNSQYSGPGIQSTFMPRTASAHVAAYSRN